MDRDAIRQECWNQALRCFGTAFIFEQRANQLRRNLRLLTFLGIVVPVSIGSIILSFGANISVLPLLLVIAGILSTIQLITSVWSLTAKWDDALAYATKSNSANKNLSLRYRDFGQSPPQDPGMLDLQFQLLQAEYQRQSIEDENQGVTEKEKRKGMRAGLREFQRPCVTCKKTPTSMTPSDCDTCGNF